MDAMRTPSKMFIMLLCLSIVLNMFDVVLHIALNQAEPLRITGNVLIIISSCVALLGHANLILVGGLIFYLILNGIFIGLDGIGSAGIVFISLTTILTLTSLWLQKISQQ